MAVKSIVDIEVNSGSFTAFKSVWDKYESQLKATPEAWGKVKAQVDGTKKGFDAIVAGMVATNVQAKLMVEAQKRADLITESASSRWQTIAKSTKEVAGNLHMATISLLKWSAISTAVTGLLGIGSLFGLDRLAGAASSNRKTANSLGASIGGNQAFNLAYERMLSDPASFQENVASAKRDYQKSAYMRSLGVAQSEIDNPDEAVTAQALMRQLRVYAKGHSEQSYETMVQNDQRLAGLGISARDLSLQKRMSDQEVAEANKRFSKERGNLNVDQSDAKLWDDFKTRLSEAGKEIENRLTKTLAPLADPLVKLSHSFSDLLDALLKGPGLANIIEKLSDVLDSFTRRFNDPKDPHAVARTATGAVVLGAIGFAAGTLIPFPGAAFALGAAGTGIGAYLFSGVAEDDAVMNLPESALSEEGKKRKIELLKIQKEKAAKKVSDRYIDIHNVAGTDEKSIAKQVARGDRNNNPGNIEYGPLAKLMGATGSDGRFAIFPTPEAGLNAMGTLLESKYNGLTLAQIQRKWVGNVDANYLSGMEKATGLGAGDVPDLHNADVRSKLMGSMAKGEGSHVAGTPTTGKSIRYQLPGRYQPDKPDRIVIINQPMNGADVFLLTQTSSIANH